MHTFTNIFLFKIDEAAKEKKRLTKKAEKAKRKELKDQ